jgi:hypothetical protein
MRLVGANGDRQIEGADELPARASYYLGNDPEQWRSNVPLYARVRYHNVYPGIDLIYYGNDERQLEHNFVVAPGADPAVIRLAFEGCDTLRLRGSEIVARVGDAEVVARVPAVYQEVEGGRRSVTGEYVLLDDRTAGFRIGDYDRARPLIIDPILSYLRTSAATTLTHWVASKSTQLETSTWLVRRSRPPFPAFRPPSPMRNGAVWMASSPSTIRPVPRSSSSSSVAAASMS